MKCEECLFDNPEDTHFCGNCAAPLRSKDRSDPGPDNFQYSQTKTLKRPLKNLPQGSDVKGKYRIIEKLGEGGMGVVYKAEDVRLKRTVALKFLSPHLTRDKESRGRFIHEAQAASGLDHPNICTIHEIEETEDGLMFIVMAYYQGETLKSRIKRGPLEIEEALDITHQVAQGLAKAHRKGIIHRDIKSANLIVTNEGVVKIVDFGLAKLAGSTQITRAGSTMGTVAYMSPEQAKGEKVDHRTDLWSLGIVLFEMLSGQLPFKGDREQTVIYSILNEDPTPISHMVADIPFQLEEIVLKCLKKSLRIRYQQAMDMLSDLSDVYGALNLTPSWKITPTARFGLKKISRYSWAWVSLAAIALIVLGLVFFYPTGSIPFQKRDWIVIADFDNQTGDDVFDKSLNTALTVNIQQSSYVNVFPNSRVKETLQRMQKENAVELDEELAIEVAQREGIKAVVSCRIDKVGDVYNLTAGIVDPSSQTRLKTEAVQAHGKDRVLAALDELAGGIRRALGESLKDIKQQRVWLEKATTPSLEALKLYTEGLHARGIRKDDEAVALLKNAIELDPDFAMAHALMGAIYYWGGNRMDGEKHFSKALELIGRLTEREKLLITAMVSAHRGNRDEAAINYKLYLRSYPDDSSGWHDLGHNFLMLKRYDEAIEAFNRCLEIYPTAASALLNIATCFSATGRYEPAIENYLKAFELNPEFLKVKNLNSEFGFTYVAMGELQKALEVFETLLLGDDSQVATAHRHIALLNMYQGKFDMAIEHLQEAILLNITLKYGLSEYRDRLYLAEAYRQRGEERALVEELTKALRIREKTYIGPWWLQLAGKMFARKGMIHEAEQLLKVAESQINKDSRGDRATIAILKGEIELARGNFNDAVSLLRQALALRDDNYVLDSLAFAYFQKRDLEKAAEEYERLVHRVELGWEAQACWIAAFYQIGRIYEEIGDTDRAIRNYRRFLDIWRDADPDIPSREDARKRLARLSTT